MKLEELKNKTKDAVNYLVQSLESGHSEVLTQYLGAMARFHTYSFGNVMLIARQKPDATNVAGIRTWNSLGRFVRRGEKGILIRGKITLLSGMKPAEEFSTLVHEIGHEMLHRGDRRTLTTKKVRETEAEAVAFVICNAIGLQNGTSSADYIQLWHGDANLLRESLEAVQQTAAVILGAITPKPDEAQESEPSTLEPGSASYSPPQMAESAAAESVPF